MKRLVFGILAHVDSGKTTLCEGLLYNAGEINKIGRVDHRNTFLDTDTIERDKGITIFSHQAKINLPDADFTLLDTPGHVDFSAEAERTLGVLDYAVLVISAADGVQSHTEFLWRMLEHYNIPTFIFINKMDIANRKKEDILNDIRKKLAESCFDFSKKDTEFYESAAMCDDRLLEEYMADGTISDELLAEAIAMRKIFPCYFGSALKNEGISEFLEGFAHYTKSITYPNEFGARIFKIAQDDKGQRLCYLKITGGSLKVKTTLCGNGWESKANELRIYSGEKYKSVGEVFSGGVCAVTGLGSASAGEGLGIEPDLQNLLSEPVFSYSVKISPDDDIHKILTAFKQLEEEDPQLRVIWNRQSQRLDVCVMGEIQLEVIKRIAYERFGIKAEFEDAGIIYRETIKNTVEGVGHYEPLKHYAEVHLLIEPQEAGSGITLKTKCPEDILDKNWQRLILTHLAEKQHVGVLTGSLLTDVKITLINGRAHKKHTEGGDFRQATYRAVRQGLMQAESVLLEPWYAFKIELPTENVGRAMTDLQQMGAKFDAPQTFEVTSKIEGTAPVGKIRDYQKELVSYTRGKGRITCTYFGYLPCTNQEEIVEKTGYDCEADIENTADSVFCTHGAGFIVKWNEVFDYMNIDALKTDKEIEAKPVVQKQASAFAADEELMRIFENTYGKIKRKSEGLIKTYAQSPKYKPKPIVKLSEYLLIDGYNIIFAWDDLKKIAKESLEDARKILTDRICVYQAVRECDVILVFDAYKVKGNQGEVEKVHGINVVYTKEAETADSYIEKTSQRLAKNYRVRVATSDGVEQLIIFGNGAQRVTPRELLEEVIGAEEEIREFIKENNRLQ